MSKKSFTGVLNTMLGEVQEPDAPKKKKGSRPTTSTSKTEKATQEARESKPKEIRATFIVREDLLEQLKDLAYWNRVTIKDVLNTFLIEVFNKLPRYILNIIGYGPQGEYLKSIANKNVIFHGSINNEELPKLFSDNEVLILPSISEPWGLVVEEAFNNGLPVIVSNRVGCAKEIVKHKENGLIFDIHKKDDLYNTIIMITDVSLYNKMRLNISKMDFEKVSSKHIELFVN